MSLREDALAVTYERWGKKKRLENTSKRQWFLHRPKVCEAMRSNALNTWATDFFNNNLEHFPEGEI